MSFFEVATIVLGAALAILLASIVAEMIKAHRRIKLEEQQDRKAKEILSSLSRNNYRFIEGVTPKVDPVHKLVSMTGEYISRSFSIDFVNGDWKVFLYNRYDERHLMSPDIFTSHLIEVRDWNQRLYEEGGFSKGGDKYKPENHSQDRVIEH